MKVTAIKGMMAGAIRAISPTGIGSRYLNPIFEVADMAQRWREAQCAFLTTPLEATTKLCNGENHLAECPVELARQELIGALNVLETLK